MLSLLGDENFNGDIIRGLLLRHSNLDLLRVQDVGLREVDDSVISAWAASNERILLTHDRATSQILRMTVWLQENQWQECL